MVLKIIVLLKCILFIIEITNNFESEKQFIDTFKQLLLLFF